MARILRGEIYWADLTGARGREQVGTRPVLVVSNDVFNTKSGTIIAMAVTSKPQRAGFPFTMPIESVKLPKPSWLKISQVRTLSTDRLRRRMGRMQAAEIQLAVEGLAEILS